MMRGDFALVLGVALVVGLAGTAAATGATGQAPGPKLDPALAAHTFADDQPVAVIVRLDPHADNKMSPEATAGSTPERLKPTLDRLESAGGVSRIRPFKLQPSFAADLTSEGLEKVLSLPGILSVEIDDRWPLHTTEGLELIGADVLHTYGFSGTGTAIAIIDTGIDALHPALGSGEIPNPKIVRGLDTADGDDDPSDCSGHGTAVASIAAGVSVHWSPGRQFAGGVAPEARIFAYKAAPDDDCLAMTESAVIAAIEDAILHREGDGYTLVAINISGGGGSWSGPCDDDNPAMAAAVDAAASAGITVVASAGNQGLSDGITSPACIENVLAVGSVWDQNPSATGSLFCLNADCTRYCSDEQKLVGQPTCYSNSGLMLDLLAPSEYLLVAEAGGQTTAFGGTSGAAPYVTGGLAVLELAHPDAPPAHMRHLLSVSNTLVTDPGNHRTLPLTDLSAAIYPEGLHLGDVLNADLPLSGSGPLTSQTIVDSRGPVGSVQLTLRITHPFPEELHIRLRGPEGHDVLVWDETVPSLSENGLIGTFPIDLKPVESLNAFVGTERHGTWELAVEDRLSEPHTAQIESWSLLIKDLTPPSEVRSPQMTYLPVAARGPGAAGTWWTTDLQILNPSAFTPIQGHLFMVQEGTNGIEEHLSRPLFIAAGAQVSLDDVVGETFGLNSGAGQVLIDASTMPLIAGGTIATQAASGGTFGQFEHGVTASSSPRLVLPHISGAPDFRTNVGLSENAGATGEATLKLFDTATGTLIGQPVELEVQPFSIQRVDCILQAAGAPQTNVDAFAVVETDSTVSAWASVVDQSTGDAVLVTGAEPTGEGPVMIPVIARTPGAAGTSWYSDVRIVAFGDSAADLRLEFRPLGAPDELPVTVNLTLEPGSGKVLNDIVGLVFGMNNVAGTLRIIPISGDPLLAVASRTYNQSLQGTYGQFIPAVTQGSRGTATVIGIDGSAGQRSNLLISEVQGEPVEIEATLRDRHGSLLGSPLFLTVEAFALAQVNDVFAAFAVSPQSNCRIDIRRTAGLGSFFALASVVDRHTGDAVAISMTEIE
ncbi:MAG: S8 family serine peptidase [Acidobacteriota bacterium]